MLAGTIPDCGRAHSDTPKPHLPVECGFSRGTRTAPLPCAAMRAGLLIRTAREAMCLGVPGRVLEVRGTIAIVDFWGVKRETRLDVVDEPVQPGDWILNHVGYALRRIPETEIRETLALYEELLGATDDDVMAADVRGEIRATSPSGQSNA